VPIVIDMGLEANGDQQMKRNFSKFDIGNLRMRAVGGRGLVAVAAALLLTGVVGTNALAAPRGGGAGFAAGHAGHERAAPFFNSAPSNQTPTFNPSSPNTMPTTPEAPVSPASPGSVFGNG
jgi:hypothetical protein